ncbi:MAG: hypothetical protein NTV56_23595 [Alphaproteobacteria bacterium]|nr:hypothetical protein [Alphaproteobacteria bacterium]
MRRVGEVDRGRGPAVERMLRASVSPLGLVALLSLTAAGPVAAQTTPQAQRVEPLKPIEVTAPRRKPRPRRAPAQQPAVAPLPVVTPSAAELRGANTTPLNTNVISCAPPRRRCRRRSA